MINLPASTSVNRFVPKEKFYSKTTMSNKLRQQFTNEIEKITWANKISPDTLNIAAGGYNELQVFEITLKGADISETVLSHIDTHIPYPILFIISKPGAYRLAISYKENAPRNQNIMKVDTYFCTGWSNDINLQLKGNSVDSIYQNFLYQIAPKLKNRNNSTTKQAVEVYKANAKIQKQIDKINKQIKSEPSIAKKQELARQRHRLEQDLSGGQ